MRPHLLRAGALMLTRCRRALAALPLLWLIGCGASFCPDQPHGWCAQHYNDRIHANNKKMAKMTGKTEDEVIAVLGQPVTIANGESGERAMVYLYLRSPGATSYFSWPSIAEGGSATHAEASRISRTFILNSQGVVERWAWKGFVGCEDCWGDSTGKASWRVREREPEAIKRDRKRGRDLTDP